MSASYTPLDHPSPFGDSPSSRNRNLFLAFAAFLSTFFVLSLSAHHNAPSSPSAQRAANYLPVLPSLSLPSSSLNEDYSLTYRQQLELSTSPPGFLTHSPTLTFSKIYVLSLPSRQDRRETIKQLADALGIEVEFVDAMDKEDSMFEWIAQRVRETRKLRKKMISKARGIPQSSIGGNTIGGDWTSPFPNSDSLENNDEKTPFPLYPLPPSSFPLLRKQLSSTASSNWVEHLEKLDSRNQLSQLELEPTSSKPINVTRLLWDPLEKVSARQITRGMMSTWWGQTRVMKRIVERADASALVLEDDVDLEWDLERLWNTVQRRLPDGWDITYLGYCWGGENQKPQYLHPLLHPSTGPMCLHAYALSLSGAKRLLSYLSSPWLAYQSAVDLAIPTLIHFDLINSFTVTPPLIVQRKDGKSDLRKGKGSSWRGLLRDSTWERVLKDRGEWSEELEEKWEDEEERDPATELRCGPVS
ncbi:uncharacterized protein JCM6883_005383 [Sporobolomyces salmoneus]|uniref:uncharacterized protein n=1 Tax=Sporobolomyces salmoneus TaxID=183962 RepID=UPI00317AC3F2